MNHFTLAPDRSLSFTQSSYLKLFLTFFAGAIGPLGFAPFHMPGFTILSIAFLYSSILSGSNKEGFLLGFLWGIGFFGIGVSWIIISIHDYGELNYLFSGLVTLAFILYLSLFPAIVTYVYRLLQWDDNPFLSCLLFCTLWCLSEYLRSFLLTGFPWLLLGTSLIDTPAKHLAPVLGVYGLTGICVLSATCLSTTLKVQSYKKWLYLSAGILLLISPSLLGSVEWVETKHKPITIAAVQANLSMRDKWDETLFWNLLKLYENATNKLFGKQLIILPESAIPLPASYLEDYLATLHRKALKAKSALILGILQPSEDQSHFFNSIATFGKAEGQHIKSQLVPFGEYIPTPFLKIVRWFNLPEFNLVPGMTKQQLIKVANHPIASLICYEIAYPHLLRNQLPKAEWIVSISDNGWFGHSLASYQQLQMAQFLSLLTGRYQILVNNDGLSSVINTQGDIVEGLPPFSAGILEGEIFPAKGATPWVIWQDYPMILFCILFVICAVFVRIRAIKM